MSTPARTQTPGGAGALAAIADRRTVSVDATPSTVTFSVTDSGPGLTSQQLQELSQPLVRGPGTSGAGSGLGLAIVAEVLAGHGSHLETGTDPTGKSTLSFTLQRQP